MKKLNFRYGILDIRLKPKKDRRMKMELRNYKNNKFGDDLG